jgi:alpha-tubulin suppressor-like RCC1 family protein
MGIGTREVHNPQPHLIESLLDTQIVSSAAGFGHTAVIDNKGQLFMFGRGREGQLGRADELESIAAYKDKPVLVEYFTKHQLHVKQVALGKDFSLAITTPNQK